MKKAFLSADCQRVLIVGKVWRTEISVQDLPSQLSFYRGLAERKGGRYRHHYTPTIKALERVQERLRRMESSEC